MTTDAEQAAPARVTPCEAVKTAGGESRRVAVARKKAAVYSDEPSLKEAMSGLFFVFETQGGTWNRTRDLHKKGSALSCPPTTRLDR